MASALPAEVAAVGIAPAETHSNIWSRGPVCLKCFCRTGRLEGWGWRGVTREILHLFLFSSRKRGAVGMLASPFKVRYSLGGILASLFKRCIHTDEHPCLNYTRMEADDRSLGMMDLCPLSCLRNAWGRTHTHTHSSLGRVTLREASTVLLNLSFTCSS